MTINKAILKRLNKIIQYINPLRRIMDILRVKRCI